MDRNKYARVHRWLTRQLGVASLCENKNCDGVSKTYHHALKKGCEYEKDINNFICLCAKCHKNYDWKPEFTNHRIGAKHTKESLLKISNANKGKALSDEHKAKLSIRFSGKNNPMYGVSIKGEDSAWYGKNHSDESKRKMSLTKSELSADTVNGIRTSVENGEQQKEVALRYGLSRASVCRIVNNKRYK